MELPVAGIGLLYIYNKIAQGRRYLDSGLQPLSNTDINDWCQLMGTTLTAYEIDGIHAIDFTTINNINKQRK